MLLNNNVNTISQFVYDGMSLFYLWSNEIINKKYLYYYLCSDFFYEERADVNKKWAGMGVLAVEMEASALYMNAAHAGKRALTICTVSDHLLTGERLSSAERQSGLRQMLEVGLETGIAAAKDLL